MQVKTWKLFTAFLCCIGFFLALSKPPQKLELDPVPEMEVGKLYNLTCRVFGVAPIRNLTVTLLKEEEQLLVKTFEDYTHPEAGVVVVNHSIIAQEDDYSKTITCQTSLDLRPIGPLLKTPPRANHYGLLIQYLLSK
ncbi:intercellular adhesion molecule 1-like isoform X2 [Thamnophis elegans]|uniref:intercellular adhesion molecule 1-like isoform X2 n=1 Tax=Thamnophis elegans TaxID=35005 RepID=UPI0013781894|nr:intercellular adhesion molecule 1-like isoform X2 [Thamnophis elegans]